MIRRFSSRRQKLDASFINKRLKDAVSYDRIAGFFRLSLLEVAGEDLKSLDGKIRVVCNSDIEERDVLTAKAARQETGLPLYVPPDGTAPLNNNGISLVQNDVSRFPKFTSGLKYTVVVIVSELEQLLLSVTE